MSRILTIDLCWHAAGGVRGVAASDREELSAVLEDRVADGLTDPTDQHAGVSTWLGGSSAQARLMVWQAVGYLNMQ